MKLFFTLIIVLFIHTISSAQSIIWQQTKMPYNGTVTAFAASKTLFFAATKGGGMFRSTDSGAKWNQTNLSQQFLTSLLITKNAVFAGSETDGVYRSTDEGNTWIAVNNGLPFFSVNALALQNDIVFAGTKGGVFSTTNNGDSWTQLPMSADSHEVSSLLITNSAIFAGTLDSGVFRSTDNGKNWTPVNRGLSTLNTYTLAANNDTIFVGLFNNGVARSTDGGANWIDVGLSNQAVVALTTYENRLLFAGSFLRGHGVFRSENNGDSWETINNGLSNRIIEALIINGDKLFAATDSGLFCSSMTPTSIDDEISRQFGLAIIPNPLSGESIVRYWLPNTMNVNIQLLTVLGQNICTILTDASRFAGENTESLAVCNTLAAGSYILKISTKFGSAISKIIIE
jgi:photosystem II stability/assembly factor-like uncharacterized protein